MGLLISRVGREVFPSSTVEKDVVIAGATSEELEPCQVTDQDPLDMTDTEDSDEKWLAKLEKRFNAAAGEDNLIDLEEFKGVLKVKKSFFAERFFQLIDADRSGSISLKELIGALRLLVYGTAGDKLHFLFQVYDADGSGFIDFDELKTVLHSCTAESALTLSDETLTELTEILFDDADVDGDGQVSFEELSEQLKRYPAITSNLSISASEWLNPRSLRGDDTGAEERKRAHALATCCSYHTLRNNLPVIIFAIVYLMLNAGLAGWGVYEGYRDHSLQQVDRHPLPICIARGAGRCLSFNCSFVLVLMLRKLLTLLRNSCLTSVLPLDHHIAIHKMVAIVIVIFTVIHVAGHCANLALIYELETDNSTSFLELLVIPVQDIGLVEQACNTTGFILVVVLLVITICSMPFIRRNGYFKVFYWTHQLCIIFWILLVLHSKYYWIWFVLPGLVYVVERFLRLQVYRRARFGITHIQEGFILPANVVHLVIQRPPNFKFHAGEYIYVNIPSIASHEWHPFTISSAPEQEEFMSLHIRSIGHWTKRLYNVFKEREEAQLETLEQEPKEEPGVEGALYLDKPLEILAEEGSIRSSVTASPARQTASNSGSPSKQNGHMSPERTKERRRKISGETNSGFEPENVDQSTVEDLNHANMGKDSSQCDIPGTAEDSPVASGYGRDAGGDHISEVGKGISSPSHGVQGADIKMTPLGGRTHADVEGQTHALPNGGATVINTTVSATSSAADPVHVLVRRTESSLSKKLLSNKTSNHDPTAGARPGSLQGGRRRSSRRKLRRNHTLHSLDAARALGGTPHTGLEIILDGPYGAPAQHIMDAEHAVLIGAGIGITPFASIVQSIHERYKAAKKHCPNCHHAWVEDTSSILKIKKVDFFWINRQQRSFEWFISLLTAIELEQAEIPASSRFLDIHLYMTSALSPSDMKAIGLHVALDLIHKKKKRDTITGLMTRTQAGRPDWEEVFQNLKRQQKGRITVFFCGSPALGKIIRKKCQEYKMEFRKENF